MSFIVRMCARARDEQRGRDYEERRLQESRSLPQMDIAKWGKNTRREKAQQN